MNDIIKKLNMENRDEVVRFLKSMWSERPMHCPLCGGKLDYFHKKAKKSNSKWICKNCNKSYDPVFDSCERVKSP